MRLVQGQVGPVNWQITPRVLTEAMAQGGDVAKRAFEAMMTMQKIDVAAIEAAVRRGAGRCVRSLAARSSRSTG